MRAIISNNAKEKKLYGLQLSAKICVGLSGQIS